MMAGCRPQPKGSREPPRVSSWFSPFSISAVPSVASSLSACGAAADGTGSSPHRGADSRATPGVPPDGTDDRAARRTPTRTYHRPRRHGIARWRRVISGRWVLCLRRLSAENPAARDENKRLAKHGSLFGILSAFPHARKIRHRLMSTPSLCGGDVGTCDQSQTWRGQPMELTGTLRK
jgi:hypothetical protein